MISPLSFSAFVHNLVNTYNTHTTIQNTYMYQYLSLSSVFFFTLKKCACELYESKMPRSFSSACRRRAEPRSHRRR